MRKKIGTKYGDVDAVYFTCIDDKSELVIRIDIDGTLCYSGKKFIVGCTIEKPIDGQAKFCEAITREKRTRIEATGMAKLRLLQACRRAAKIAIADRVFMYKTVKHGYSFA